MPDDIDGTLSLLPFAERCLFKTMLPAMSTNLTCISPATSAVSVISLLKGSKANNGSVVLRTYKYFIGEYTWSPFWKSCFSLNWFTPSLTDAMNAYLVDDDPALCSPSFFQAFVVLSKYSISNVFVSNSL